MSRLEGTAKCERVVEAQDAQLDLRPGVRAGRIDAQRRHPEQPLCEGAVELDLLHPFDIHDPA